MKKGLELRFGVPDHLIPASVVVLQEQPSEWWRHLRNVVLCNGGHPACLLNRSNLKLTMLVLWTSF